MLTFPTGLFCPAGLTPRLLGGALAGGQSLSGLTQYAMTTGGPYWAIDFANVVLWDLDKYKTWAAVAAACDNGATPFVVPLCDRRSQPFTNPKRDVGIGNGDDSKFGDGALWSAEYITSTLIGTAALRATSLHIACAGGKPLEGGEHFTIWGLERGQRMYRVITAAQRDDDTWDITIRPPLREALADGVTLDFDNPRCVMRVDGDMSATLDMLKRGSGQVRFVETFRPVGE
jgi:hypothetical protein